MYTQIHTHTHSLSHSLSHTLSLTSSLTHSLGQLFYEIRRSIILHLTFPFRKAKDTHCTVFFDPGLALSLFVLGDELFGSVLSHVQEFAYIYIYLSFHVVSLFVCLFLSISFFFFRCLWLRKNHHHHHDLGCQRRNVFDLRKVHMFRQTCF